MNKESNGPHFVAALVFLIFSMPFFITAVIEMTRELARIILLHL